MKHVPLPRGIHPARCTCPNCAEYRRQTRVAFLEQVIGRFAILAAVIALAVIPGRWLAGTAWRALSALY